MSGALTRLASELCSERLAKVKQSICNIVRFMVVLKCVFDQICVNIRVLGMRVKTNGCTLSRPIVDEFFSTVPGLNLDMCTIFHSK